MMTTRRFRAASVLAGLVMSLFAVAPLAHADDLDNLRGTVNGDRLKYGPSCAPLKYNQTLQDIGFAQGQFIPAPNVDQLIGSYPGEVRSFIGSGNEIGQSRTDAYKKGAGGLVGNCDWTEFGVSFVRYETTETDWVGIIFGKPNAVAAPAKPPQGGGTPDAPANPPAQEPVPVPVAVPVTCPAGSPKTEVPAGQTCPEPKNAIAVTFVKPPIVPWTVNVKNSAGIGGSCTYDATAENFGFPLHVDFDIDANGTASFTVPNPQGNPYNVVTACTGTYDGRQVEFGRTSQKV